MTMRSKYTIRVYEYITEELKNKKVYGNKTADIYLSLDELRKVTSTTKKFNQVGQFKSKVLDVAIKEIEGLGIVINYENVKEGRTIIGFSLHLQSRFYTDDQLDGQMDINDFIMK